MHKVTQLVPSTKEDAILQTAGGKCSRDALLPLCPVCWLIPEHPPLVVADDRPHQQVGY